LDANEFVVGLSSIFTSGFDVLSQIIFKIYDFDKNGKISKEDVRTILSYVPLKNEKYSALKLKYENEEFKDRVESQDEMHHIITRFFGKNEYLTYKMYVEAIQNVSSEIFLYILIFIMDKRPFTKNSIENFKVKPKSTSLLGSGINISKSPSTNSKVLIASPSLQSKFAPSVTISKSPSMSKREIGINESSESKNKLQVFSGKDPNAKNLQPSNTSNILLKYSGKADNNSKTTTSTTSSETTKKVVPLRKEKNNLKGIEDVKDFNKKLPNEYDDLSITPACKISR
jgi:hypothetical protein